MTIFAHLNKFFKNLIKNPFFIKFVKINGTQMRGGGSSEWNDKKNEIRLPNKEVLVFCQVDL